MKEGITVNDALVVQDGGNPSFFAWMDQEETQRIQNSPSGYIETVHFRETADRPVPQSLKEGITEIKDIFVKLEPNVCRGSRDTS